MRLVKFWLCGLVLFSASLASAASPDFVSLGAVSSNATSTLAKAADTITFTLTINAAEDSDGTGVVTFDVGALAGQTATFTAAGASTTHTATYVVPAGANGALSISSLTFQNTGLETIINVPGTPFAPAPNVTVDTTTPTLNPVGISSNNANTSLAKVGDTVTLAFTGSEGLSNVSATIATQTATVSNVGGNNFTATFVMTAGQAEGVLPFTVDFEDPTGNTGTTVSTVTDGSSVTFDKTAPVITFTDDVATGPLQSDDVVITVTETDPNAASFEFGFSPDAVCDGTDTFGNAFTSGGTNTFNTEANNGSFVCARASDNAGNETFALSGNTLNIDVTAPSVTGTVQASSNLNPAIAEVGDTVTYTITYNEAVTVGPVNVASSANNATGAVTEVGATNSATDTLIVTVQAGDNGVITPNVNFDITDSAGNSSTITSLAPITGGSGTNTITADTIDPDFVSLGAASSGGNTAFAKAGDTITFTLTLAVAEDSNGTGQVTFDIGLLTGQTASFPLAAASLTHTATYTVPAGANGDLSVTNLTFVSSNAMPILNVPLTPFAPSPNVTVDTLAPVLASIGAVSNNADTTKAKAGDSVTFTLNLTAADTWAPGNTLNYAIGAGASTPLPAAFVSTSGTATKLSGSRSITIVAGDTGTFNIDSLTFFDRAGNAITGFLPGSPAPQVTVDTTAPVLAFTDDVAAGPVQSDDITITVTDLDINAATLEFGFSPDSTCNASDTFGNAFVSGVAFTFNNEVTNGQFICARALDNSGNVAFLGSTNDLNIDITPPSVNGTVQASSNANPGFAKAGDTVTYTITYNEVVTVGPVNVASSANNATGAVTEVSATSNASDTLVVTVQAGDNGVITPNLNFDITDVAGNTSTITSLAPISGGTGGVITADTTNPVLDTVNISSNNANSSAWATTGNTITVSIDASELLQTTSVTGTIAGKTANVTKTCAGTNCETYNLTLLTSGNEPEGVVAFTINFIDEAGNSGAVVSAVTDASSVTFDKTPPGIDPVSIVSNNALDTTLAKTNDTIFVNFTIADNLATTASLSGGASILRQPANSVIVGLGAGNSISRFTDGTENSEVTTDFNFTIQDEAGNTTSVSATTDGSSVQFDRTDPVVSNVQISATSADGSAFLGDAPTFYAKQGDTIDFQLEVCDFVDSQNNPPTGDIFSSVGLTLTDAGLTGANCTTPEGNTVGVRRWTAQLAGIDGTEGTVTFDIDVNDNAGNLLVNVAATTNGSSVIFDKTVPLPPTDMVDLGGVAIARFKPSTFAEYSWTNDSDPLGTAPVSGVQNYDVRFFNPNTAINEQVTVTPQAFIPTLVIADNDPYEVHMRVRDNAGNLAPEALVYNQQYAPTIFGTVTDKDTGQPLSGVRVNAIAAFGQECDTGFTLCTDLTDANGRYDILVQPNQTYTLDFVRPPDYYIGKDQVVVAKLNVKTNASLKHVDDGDVQTGAQGTIIVTDASFELNNVPQTTYINVFSESGEISVEVLSEGIRVTSFGKILRIVSNNPNVTISNTGQANNNTYLVTNAGNITSQTDVTNSASTVSSTFESGDNRVGTSAPLGGASAGFQAGLKRSERVVNQGQWTYEESKAFAKRLNEGTPYKVAHYVNRNGYTVFAGYQPGRLPIADMKGSDPAIRLEKKIVYRGPRRGSETTYQNVEIADRREIVKTLFDTEVKAETAVADPTDASNRAAERSLTKKTARTYNNPELSGYGRKVEMYPSVHNKRENDARYVNKFARVTPPADIAPSRIRGKNANIIVLRGKGRGSRRATLGQVFGENQKLINGQEKVVRR